MPFWRHCIALVLCAALAVTSVSAQDAGTQDSTGAAEFIIFVGGRQAGNEQVNVSRSGGNWVITSTGRLTSPVDLTINRFEVKYAADWQPLELTIDARMGGQSLALSTSFGMTTAINEITQGTTTNSKTDQVSARTVVLPNNFYAAYEALAARLATASAGTELPIYVAPQTEIKGVVNSVTPQQVKTNTGTLELKKVELVFQNPGGPLPATVTIDARNRLARVDIQAAGLSVVRSDLAGVSVRTETVRNPTDTDVRIPALGFSLAGTITMPPQVAGRLRYPAIVLVPGSGPVDRDVNVYGIPIFAQLAGALAERGFIVLRYDKRAVGQSGGRAERATLADYADDVLAAVKYLRSRKDVDRNRIAVVGHSEGGAVGMLAAKKEDDDIAALVLIAAPGTRGSDLILEQQQYAFDTLKLSEEDRKQKVDLQQRIQTAVLTGIGWESIPPEIRKAADTPWFKSLLEFNPADVMKDVEQPVLIIQGDLDRQVAAHHADKLADMARNRKKKVAVDVLHLPDVNHQLVPATTGDPSEYATLPEKKVVSAIPDKIAEFLSTAIR
jgi:pimeloyl-ACP methyl ester carboxylesterase